VSSSASAEISEIEMTFLISTSQHILLLETSQNTAYRVHSGNGLYYGLCLHRGRVIAGCRNRLPCSDNSQRAEERGSLLFFDARLHVEAELQPPFPLRDLHGLALIDERVWVTCSFDNLVAIFDPATESWNRWYPSPDPLARDRDVHHFNTIAKIGDCIALLAHNWGPSLMFFYRYPSLELERVRPLGTQAHNVFAVAGSLATCSSAEGLIVAESGWQLRTGGFPRGFAASEGVTLVGLSRSASRDERAGADGVIRVFDDGWRFQTDYVLRGVGMILDILPISLDKGLLHGLDPWPYVQIHQGQYNPEDPGDSFFPGQPGDEAGGWWEWHKAEDTHRWTAACNAGMTVIINPGENLLAVEAMSGFPGRYGVEVCLEGIPLGRMEFSTAGVATATFALKEHAPGPARLSFHVPQLWKPADQIAGNGDLRSLGIAVLSVRLRQDAAGWRDAGAPRQGGQVACEHVCRG